MVKIIINENDSGQRLDRFLRKYLKNAPLSYIYRIVRKDVKVNGIRAHGETMLAAGDELVLYINEDMLAKFAEKKPGATHAKRSFAVIYEDENILIASKPYGLLTHGDGKEKKNTLVNQVTDYLIEKGEYNPRRELSFSPAAANRLDRNTTGLVAFGKNAAALRDLNAMIRDKGSVRKFYLTIVAGELDCELHLRGLLTKDAEKNTVKVTSSKESRMAGECGTSAYSGVAGTYDDAAADAGDAPGSVSCAHDSMTDLPDAKYIETIARPVKHSAGGEFTLLEVELVTGRTHQIRAHLADAGYPIIGDPKYGDTTVNKRVASDYGLKAQLLHACRLEFRQAGGSLDYLCGRIFTAEPPKAMKKIIAALF